MKKSYINPNTEIIQIESQQLMAGSPELGGGEYGGGTPEANELFLDLDD